MLTTGYQLRAARSLIGMEQAELASKASLNVNTIRSMEASGSSAIAGRAVNVQAVQRALEAAGVEFLNHGQPGVRLRKLGTIQLTDQELFRRYLGNGPCLVRSAGGGEQSPTLRAALNTAEKIGASSIEVLNQAVGQILIGSDQMRRLIDLLADGQG